MTISNTASAVSVQGNGAQTVFNYGFEIAQTAGFTLYYEDAYGNVTMLNPATYQVSGLGNSAGGTFTYPLASSGAPPIAGGTSLTLVRQTPNQQDTSLGNQGAYYPAVVEEALDWIVYQLQETVNEDALTIRAQPTDAALNLLPSAQQRAGGYLAFDSNGQPIVTLADDAPAQAIAAQFTIFLMSLPTVEPVTAGRLWWNGQFLAKS